MIDFKKLGEEMKIKRAMQGPSYPYADEDRDNFDGRALRTGTLTLTADFRRDPIRDQLVVKGVNDRGQRVEIVFSGIRADDFKQGLGALLVDLHQTAILNDDFRDANAFHHDATLTGTFRKRSWKKSDGTWTFVWQLFAAEWSYETLERGKTVSITEGRRPSEHYATPKAA